jgi:hypothetical protein
MGKFRKSKGGKDDNNKNDKDDDNDDDDRHGGMKIPIPNFSLRVTKEIKDSI